MQRAEVTKLRTQGRVPATIYGRKAAPQNLEVNAREFSDLLHHSVSENLLVDLSRGERRARAASRARAGCPASSAQTAKCSTLIFMKFPPMKM